MVLASRSTGNSSTGVVILPDIKPSILDAIGNTPLVHLQRMGRDSPGRILAKVEFLNPSGSIKARSALGMIEAAERAGQLKPGSIVVEATSGNQGIGIAMVAAVKGYRSVVVMPENMSEERQKFMRAYGAEIRLVPAGTNIQEAIQSCLEEVRHMAAEDPRVWVADQFNNPANPEVHRRTTAQEILRQVDGPIDAFVAGVGTGGTLTGVGEVLKEHFPEVKIVAVEPAKAAILSGGPIEHHMQQGIGDGLIPSILNRDIIDEIVVVTDEDAMDTARRLAREEGLFVGVSSGANVWASLEIARRLGKDVTVVTVLPDGGDRYLSTGIF